MNPTLLVSSEMLAPELFLDLGRGASTDRLAVAGTTIKFYDTPEAVTPIHMVVGCEVAPTTGTTAPNHAWGLLQFKDDKRVGYTAARIEVHTPAGVPFWRYQPQIPIVKPVSPTYTYQCRMILDRVTDPQFRVEALEHWWKVVTGLSTTSFGTGLQLKVSSLGGAAPGFDTTYEDGTPLSPSLDAMTVTRTGTTVEWYYEALDNQLEGWWDMVALERSGVRLYEGHHGQSEKLPHRRRAFKFSLTI